MDATDHKIIGELRKNARQPIRTIAKKTGLRPSTVHTRMQRLKDDRAIERYTVKLDSKAVGEDFVVFMFVTTANDLPQSFFSNRHVKEAYGVTGEYDIVMRLAFADINEFNNYIIGLRKNKSIVKTLTSVATIKIKDEV